MSLSELNPLLRAPYLRASYFAHPGLKAVSTLAFAEMVQKYGGLVESQEKYCWEADWFELREVLKSIVSACCPVFD